MFGKVGNLGLNLSAVGGALSAGIRLITVPHATNYPWPFTGSYALYGFVFGAGSYVYKTDYDAEFTFDPAQFPDNVLLNTYNPDGWPINAGIWGYHHISYDLNKPCVISNLTSFKIEVDWSCVGSDQFNYLIETWLAGRPYSPNYQITGAFNDAVAEPGIFFRCPNYSFHNGGTLIGTTHTNEGRVYTVRKNGGFITVAPQNEQDIKTGTFDVKAYFDYLIFHGALTGSEWFLGKWMFGIEPTNTATGAGRQTYAFSFKKNRVTDYTTNIAAPIRNFVPGTQAFNETGYSSGVGAMTITTGQPDMDGTNLAVRYMETTETSSDHGFFKPPGDPYWMTLHTREVEYVWTEDLFPIGGRNKYEIDVATPDFSSRFNTRIDTTAMTCVAAPSNNYGSALTLVSRSLFDLGNGWFRFVIRFRKASGLTSLFMAVRTVNASDANNFAGEVTKGFRLRNSRGNLIQDDRLFVTAGTPASSAPLFTAYNYAPSVFRGGKGVPVWSITGGALPAGLTLNTATGAITGSPSEAGSVTGLSLRVTEGDGTITVVVASFGITTAAAPNLATTNISGSGWTRTGVTVANAGASNQALMETTGASGEHFQKFTSGATAMANTVARYRVKATVTPINGRTWLQFRIGNVAEGNMAGGTFTLDASPTVTPNVSGTGITNNTPPTVVNNGDGSFNITMDINWPTALQQFKIIHAIMQGNGQWGYVGNVASGQGFKNLEVVRVA